MKKKLSMLMVAILGIVAFATAAWRAAGDPLVLYSWESPEGTAVEQGGTATYENGKEGEDRVNYKQADYWTICLNGKKANLDDETASANAGHIKITFNQPLAKGDKIEISAFLNKNESKKSSAYIVFEKGGDADSGDYGDESNIGLDPAGSITTKTVEVPEAADGSNYIKLTRGTSGTNLFITKLVVTRADDGSIKDIASLNALESGATFTYSGKATIVAMPKKNAQQYVYVQDETGSTLIYDKDGSKTSALAVGKQIAAPWTGAISFYQNLFEVVPDAALAVTEDPAVTPTIPEVALSDITADNVNKVVKLTNVTIGSVNGKNFQLTKDESSAAGYDQFGVKGADFVNGAVCTEIIGAIGRYNDNIQFQPLSYTIASSGVDIVVSPESGDIAAAVATAIEGKEVKSITINLTKDVTYTIGATLITATDFTINGNGATIDASALEANMIQWKVKDAEDTEWTKADVAISDVTVKGLKKALFYSAGKYYYGDFTLTNSVIEQAADATTFDYTKGSAALNFTVTGSTVYAATATTKSLYSSQSGQKATEYSSDAKQIFTFQNNTMYNLAKTKNFFTHRQSNQKWLTYDVLNNIFVNCGKSGQVIKGMNGGQGGANPTWIIMGNTFNYEGSDTSAGEVTGDAEEPVKDNVAGVVTFTDAATGNFSGAFVATEGAFVPGEMPGDPRWTITATASTVPAPEIDGQEKFIGKQNITLSCEMENTKIFYTTDGNDPTIESTLYAEPFEISETTTVKAIAVFAFAGKNYTSAVASKTFTLQTTFATIAELIQLPDGTGFGYTEDVKVVAQAKAGEDTYTYIKDESGATVIFDAGSAKTPAEAVGKKIAKDWVGTVTNYHGVLVNVAPEVALTLTEDAAEEVTYPVVEFGYVDVGHVNEVVMLSGVTYQFVNNEDLTISTMDGETSINAFNKFALNPGYAQKGVEYNIVGAISYETDHVVFVPIEFIEKPTVDITVFPEDGTDISAAIDEASKGHFVRNITINLAAVDGGSAQYTITKSIDAAGCVVINGNGAMIDASALEGPFVLMSTTPRVDPVKVGDNDVFVVDNISFKELAIFGLKNQLFYANKVRYLVRSLSVDNSVIAIDGTAKKTIFDFNGRGNAEELTVKNSTLWAEPSNAQNGGLYSSQSGDGAMDLGGTKQVLSIQNSTLYNIASGKTTCSQRRNDVTGMEFILKNNVIVNCGKVGEFVAGLDGGSYKSKPVWDIQNNAFNVVKYNEDGTFTSQDVSEKEAAKMGNDIVKDSYVGSVYFKNVASGDFAIDAASAAALGNAGDTHWGTYEVAHYMLAVSETALEFADFTVQPFALEDEVVKVDVQEHNGFKMTELIAKVGAQTKLTVTDNSFIMPPANVGIDATFQKVAADYELAPAAGTDIAEALDGLIIRNLKLTLAEGGAYTLTKPIEFSGNLELTGNGATVDASALEAAFVNLAAEPAIDPIVEKKTDEATGETTETILSYPIDKVSISGVTIKGLSQQLVKSNNLYLVKDLTVDNSVVERLGVQKKSLFDFSGGTGGNVINLTVNKSTLYSDATTQHQNGDFFTSQSSKSIDQMGVDVTAEGFKATTTITNSTLYGIASGKTVSSLRKNSQAYMLYVVKNNVIVNSGKSGQFVKGLNAGSDGAAENYDADTNLFNFNNDVVEETAAKSAENVKNSVNAIVTFKDVEAGDFNMSIFKDPRVAELPAIGDPRWAVTGVTTGYAINIDEAIENGAVTASKSWSAADETIKLTVTPDEGYELESITVKMGAAEIILEEDNSFIMPAADVTVSATFIAVPKLYIIGGPKDWNLADMTELKYNLETQTYELDYAPTATAYFAFADKQFTAEEAAAEGAWDVFNANNRLALGEGDIEATLNEPVDLKKVNGTIILKAGTYKISVTKDLKVTIAGEPAPEPTVEKLFIMGTATAKGWDGTTEMTFNEADQAFEYELENADKIYITFGDAEFTDWGDFNANHRFAIAGGDNVAPVDEEFTLVKVEGTLVLEAGAYKISVTKDLKCKITAVPTGINAIAVDKLDNAVIYNLQGQRVEKSQAKGGVFIVNGKKVAIK